MNNQELKQRLDSIEQKLDMLLEAGTQQTDHDMVSTYDKDAPGWTRLPDGLIGKTGKCNRCGKPIWWQKCATRKGIKNLPFYPENGPTSILTLHSFDCVDEPDDGEALDHFGNEEPF